MIQYKLQKGSFGDVVAVTIVGRNISIPLVEGNTDYQEYLKWLAEGNTPEPADEQN
jgi:hypothetical protein